MAIAREKMANRPPLVKTGRMKEQMETKINVVLSVVMMNNVLHSNIRRRTNSVSIGSKKSKEMESRMMITDAP